MWLCSRPHHLLPSVVKPSAALSPAFLPILLPTLTPRQGSLGFIFHRMAGKDLLPSCLSAFYLVLPTQAQGLTAAGRPVSFHARSCR